MSTGEPIVDLGLPSTLTPASRVTWTVIAGGIYNTYHVFPMYITPRWGIVPYSEPKQLDTSVLHICSPRKTFWATRNEYRRRAKAVDAPILDDEYRIELFRDERGLKWLYAKVNGVRTLAESELQWYSRWQSERITYGEACLVCGVEIPGNVLGMRRMLKAGRKL